MVGAHQIVQSLMSELRLGPWETVSRTVMGVFGQVLSFHFQGHCGWLVLSWPDSHELGLAEIEKVSGIGHKGILLLFLPVSARSSGQGPSICYMFLECQAQWTPDL